MTSSSPSASSASRQNASPENASPENALIELIEVMAALRHPEKGCEWDIRQTHATIAPYTIEEAYEVADAIHNGSVEDLRDELGDLLLQVIFQARIAEEAGDFAFADIARSITAKMIRRHPHIFGEGEDRTAEQQRQAWEDMKVDERAAKKMNGVLDDVATTLPPMTRAVKLQKRAARVGFDWTDPKPVMDKVLEELDEVKAELNAPTVSPDLLEEEIGDLLFAVVNLARKSGVDPDEALARTNRKFTRRFQHLEHTASAQGTTLDDTDLVTMENWWQSAKQLPGD